MKRVDDYIGPTTPSPHRDFVNEPPFEDPDWVEAEDVQTEYERGYQAGVASREGLAIDVMRYTAEIEERNLNLDG